MLVDCKLHNLCNIEINIQVNKLFDLVECEEFKMIRCPHIIIQELSDENDLENSDDNIEPRDANRKYIGDVFKAFPDVQFTIYSIRCKISSEKAINFHKKYQNVIFDFNEIYDGPLEAFSRHLES